MATHSTGPSADVRDKLARLLGDAPTDNTPARRARRGRHGPSDAEDGPAVAVGQRPALGSRYVSVALVIGGIALAIAAWWVLSAKAVPVAPPTPTTPPATQSSGSSTNGSTPVDTNPTGAQPTPQPASSQSAAPMVVHVTGAVATPGLQTHKPGARVGDAIERAGGFTEDAAPGRLNLAEPLSDGAQVYVARQGEDAGSEVAEPADAYDAAGRDPSAGLVDLNQASAAELESLPGVGPVTAGAIIAYRDAHGGFTTVEELRDVDGIGPKTFATVAPLVTV